jgi:hypothetical protein
MQWARVEAWWLGSSSIFLRALLGARRSLPLNSLGENVGNLVYGITRFNDDIPTASSNRVDRIASARFEPVTHGLWRDSAGILAFW